jgi:hypothetical protein
LRVSSEKEIQSTNETPLEIIVQPKKVEPEETKKQKTEKLKLFDSKEKRISALWKTTSDFMGFDWAAYKQ